MRGGVDQPGRRTAAAWENESALKSADIMPHEEIERWRNGNASGCGQAGGAQGSFEPGIVKREDRCRHR